MPLITPSAKAKRNPSRRTLELMLVMGNGCVRTVRVDVSRNWLAGRREWAEDICVLKATLLADKP